MPVRNEARLGEHIAVAVQDWVKDSAVRRSSASFGISCSSQPGSSGQCIGVRCWSVISSTMFGLRMQKMYMVSNFGSLLCLP